jgi:hypothetical protein
MIGSKNLLQKLINEKITYVTGLYDIGREKSGDGRKFEDYKVWFRKTLILFDKPIVVFCEKSLEVFVQNIVKGRKNVKVIIQELNELEYYQYLDNVNNVCRSDSFKSKMNNVDRLENKLPLYNLVIFNKSVWMDIVGKLNPFNTELFGWIDAGISRFIDTTFNINVFPNLDKIDHNKINMQCNLKIKKLKTKNAFKDIMFHTDHYTTATLYFANSKLLSIMRSELKEIFMLMLDNNCINNEQIATTILYLQNPNLFNLFENNTNLHLSFIQYLSK